MEFWSLVRCRIVIVCALVATAGFGPPAVTAAVTPAAKTVVFGAAVSLTGSTSHEGALTKEGYDFWVAYVNAHGGLRVGNQRYKVAIRYADDTSSPPVTAARLESLIDQEHVDFILGPYGSGPTFSAAAVAERREIPMVDSGGAAENIFNQGYRYTVNVMSPARKYLVGIIEYAIKRNPQPKTIAISAASDAFSLEVQQGAVQSANDHGIHVVYADRYSDDPATVAAAAAAIKAADPDIVLNAGHLQDALLMQRALKEQHVRAKIYGYTNGPDVPEFRTSLGSDAEGVLGSAQWSPAVTYAGAPGFYRSAREYADAFTASFGHAPDYHNAEATAAGLAFQYALERAKTTDRAAVRDALARLDVVTFFGLLKFDSRGVNVFKPMVVNQIQRGKLVTIYPYRLANAAPVYPAPAWTY
jgi:branched-chain amino acid transport system substrate-binding protein